MKTLKLAINLGNADAKRLGLEDTRMEGETVNVTPEVADELLRRGWAVEPSAKAAVAAVAAPESPDFDAMTKEELHEHARANAIEGVSMAQPKDEMVKVIKRANRK